MPGSRPKWLQKLEQASGGSVSRPMAAPLPSLARRHDGNIIGIHFGDAHCSAAIMQDAAPALIAGPDGAVIIPPLVSFTREGTPLVGPAAKRRMVTDPERTIYGIRSLIGRRYDDPVVAKIKNLVPYRIVEATNGDACIELEGAQHSPRQIAALILQALKNAVESSLDRAIEQAVITVPARFDDTSRQAVKDAGKAAGFDAVHIIDEPVAAALAYGLGKQKAGPIAVYDLGGTSFDISILEIADGQFTVKATGGDLFLGGEDFDKRLVDYLADTFRKEHGIDLRDDPIALQRLKEAAEKAKIDLSSGTQTEIDLQYISAVASGPLHLTMTITRAAFEKLTGNLIQKTIRSCQQTFDRAGIEPASVSDVVLTSGMTRMPKVRAVVKDLFGKEPLTVIDPATAVVAGAAIFAVTSGNIAIK